MAKKFSKLRAAMSAETQTQCMGSDVKRESLCDQEDDAFASWADKTTDGLKYQEQLRSEWERPSHNELRARQPQVKVNSEELIRADRDER